MSRIRQDMNENVGRLMQMRKEILRGWTDFNSLKMIAIRR